MSGDVSKLAAQAVSHLNLVDVYMRRTQVQISESFDPRGFPPGTEFSSQFRHFVYGTETLAPEDGVGEVFFRTLVEVAVRWGNGPEASNHDSNDDSFVELGRIEATFVAEYTQNGEVTDDCLQAYSLKWPSVHVWPYWREYVASTCVRFGVPKIVMPVMARAQNADALPSEVKVEAISKMLYTKERGRLAKSKGRSKGKKKT